MPFRIRAILIVSILFILSADFYTDPTPPPPATWRPTIDRSEPILLRTAGINFALESPDSPSGEIDWAYVVYQSYHTGNWEIFTAYNDGSEPVNRTNNPSQDYYPSIKKDGTQTAFTSTRDGNPEIYKMNIDGSEPARLTSQPSKDYSPTWSPDGNKIAFVSERSGNPEIYAMNADGSNVVRLTSNVYEDLYPAWSPDGLRIAWIEYTDDYWGHLAIMNADGSNKMSRTSNLLFPGGTSWSPDGRYIIIDMLSTYDGTSELAAIDVINGVSPYYHYYYDPGDISPSTAIDAWTGAFSPDGKTFMYVRAIWRSANGGQSYYLDQTWLEKIEPPPYPGTPVPIHGSGMDSNPSWGSRDLLPPRTRVYLLPEYSRAARFLIRWGGFDQGIAGLKDYHAQFRNDDDLIWGNIDFVQFGPATYKVMSHSLAQRVFFRVRGRDYASNVEEWPASPDGDTYTTLYAQMLSGHIRDMRGIPVPNASLNAPAALNDSPTTGLDGAYTAYMPSDSVYSLTPSHSGYGTFSEARLLGKADHIYNQYLPPVQDVVFNGDFENGLEGWQVDSEIGITRVISGGLTGLSAAQLGPDCNGLCLDEPIDRPDTTQMVDYDVSVADDGTLHLLWTKYSNNSWYTLTHSVRIPDGSWLDPVFLYDEGMSSTPNLVMDSTGTLHAVWVTSSGMKYAYKPAGGSWSDLENLPSGANPKLAVDSAGNVYVIYYYRETWGFYRYTYRNTSGVWSSPISLTARAPYTGVPGIYAASDGTVHFTYMEDAQVFTRSRTPSGALTPAVYLDYLSHFFGASPKILERSDGTLIAVGGSYDEGYYFEKPSGEDWQVPGLPKLDGEARILQTVDGKVHLLNTSENQTYYRFWQQDMGWSDPLPVDVPLSEIGVDSYDNLFIITPYEGKLYISSRATTASTASLSQQVSIPEDTLHPTLAWQHLFAGLPTDNSYLDVYIDNGVSQTSVYSSTGNGLWQQAWADLSQWAGQTVTVNFRLNQAAGEPQVNVNLDDVSVGAWETPVISSVSPQQLDNWLDAMIMITGENFIQKPAVRLDQTVLVNVNWVDENTLTAQIPPDLAAGHYDVWVINPNGVETVLPNGLLLGKVAYFPLVFR